MSEHRLKEWLSSKGAQFVDLHRSALIHMVTMVMPVMDDLLSLGELNKETYLQIKRANTKQEQMRELYKALDTRGYAAKCAFYSALMKHEPLLLQKLGGDRRTLKPLEQAIGKRVPLLPYPPGLTELHTTIQQYKTSVIDNCTFVTEFNLSPDERVKLDDRYIEPKIIQMSKKYGTRTSHKLTLDQLFYPDSDGKKPKSVILSGESGSGKSFMLQKMMLDWARGTAWFDVVFFLKYEELRCVSEEMSLIALLSRSCSFTADQISQLLSRYSQDRILFIIDGYNVLTLKTQFQPPDTFQGDTCLNTLNSLLNGDILPESFLLVTSRSLGAEDVEMLKEPKCFFESQGFPERGVEEYFQKFFQDEQLFRKAYKCVKASETLQIASSVPLLCWIICFCLKNFPDGEDEMRKLKTTTSIYVHFVSKLLEHHCRGQSVFTLLQCLGQLADRGMKHQQVLFDERSLAQAGLAAAASLFLSEYCFKTEDKQDPVFKFIHLSLQEFFTALHCVLLDEESSSDIVRQWFNRIEIEAVTSSPSQNVRARRSGHMPFVWFLCGLSDEKVSGALLKKHNCTVPHIIREKLEVMMSRPQNKDLHLALHCLFELHDDEFVRKVLKVHRSMDFSHICLRRTDCWVMLYCLQCCPHITELNLTNCDLTAEKLRILQPALSMCESLRLTVDHLSEVGDLIKALGNSKILRELRVQEDEYSGGTWSLDLSVTQEDLLLCVSLSEKNPLFSSLLKISFTCPESAMSSFNWTLLLKKFWKGDKLANDSSEIFESLLLSSIHSVGLKTFDLEVNSLTKIWAAGIISIIQTCSSLQQLRVSVSGLLLEEGLMLLQESLTDPHCTVIIKGLKCRKPAEQCVEEEWRLRCNEKVEIYFKPKVLEDLEAMNICDPESSGLNVPLPDCQCCVHIVDSDQWLHIEPSVCRDEGESKFHISTPPGRYECTRTKLRWVCDCDVTLLYHAVDGRSLIPELERLQCERIGPVFDVTVISGELKEAHLPHFVCLAESDPSLREAVKALSKKDEGIVLRSVELTRFHAKISQPSFSIITLIMNLYINWEEHCNLLLYMRRKDPVILHVYFFPLNDSCSEDKVKQKEESSLQISHPRPNMPFQMKTPHLLEVPDALVHPVEGISFRRDIEPNFFKVKPGQDVDVQMTLIREQDRSTVWNATICKTELSPMNPTQTQNEPQRHDGIDVNNFVHKHWSALIERVSSVKRIADKLREKNIIQKQIYSEIINAHLTSQDSMRRICSIVDSGVWLVKANFICILQEEEPYLYQALTGTDVAEV